MYNEHIDNKGHQYGPQSSELKKAVQEVDGQLDTFLKHLEADKLDQQVRPLITVINVASKAKCTCKDTTYQTKSTRLHLPNCINSQIAGHINQDGQLQCWQVNVMIVSDHGMAAGGSESGVEYIEIDDYVDLDDVICIIDRGAVTSVAPLPGKADKVL